MKNRKEYDAKYYQDHRDQILANKKESYQKNRGAVLENTKMSPEQNKAHKREYHNEYQRVRKANDPNFRIRATVSANIGYYLKSNGSSKNNKSCLTYLQYTIDQLRTHLESLFESWMSWNNYGKYDAKTWDDDDPLTWTWQIDHIIPQSKLPYTFMTDDNFKKCWALENMRPLSSKQNFLDGVRRLRHKVSV